MDPQIHATENSCEFCVFTHTMQRMFCGWFVNQLVNYPYSDMDSEQVGRSNRNNQLCDHKTISEKKMSYTNQRSHVSSIWKDEFLFQDVFFILCIKIPTSLHTWDKRDFLFIIKTTEKFMNSAMYTRDDVFLMCLLTLLALYYVYTDNNFW